MTVSFEERPNLLAVFDEIGTAPDNVRIFLLRFLMHSLSSIFSDHRIINIHKADKVALSLSIPRCAAPCPLFPPVIGTCTPHIP